MAIDLLIYLVIGFAIAVMWNSQAKHRLWYRRIALPLIWIGWPFYLIGRMGWYIAKLAAARE